MQPLVEPHRRSDRRDRIMRAASRIFSRRPFGNASMEEIALEAGVGKPTLYRYFTGKDDLFAAVFSDVLDSVEERLDSVLGAGTAPVDRLLAMATIIVPVFRDHLVTGRLVDEGAEADRSKRRVFRDRQARLGARLAQAIADGIGRGEFRPVDPARTARLMLGALWSGAAAGDGDDRTVAAEVVALLLHGLAAVPSPHGLAAVPSPSRPPAGDPTSAREVLA